MRRKTASFILSKKMKSSHVLYIHGDADSGALYAYIELFNMQNLIFIFTMDYDGKDIDVTYCRDIMKDEELSKK